MAPCAIVAEIERNHSVNANQVHAWRRLFRDGHLDVAPQDAALLPVRLSEPAPPPTDVIFIECGRGRLRIEGGADSLALRVALECLTR